MHRFENVARTRDRIFRAFDLDLVAARRDIDAQPVFDVDEVGVELTEQRAQDCRFVEFDLCAGAALLVAPGGGQGLCRTFGTGRFATHSVLSGLRR